MTFYRTIRTEETMNATPRPWYWHKMTNEWPTICCDTGLNADRPVALVFGPNAEANNAEKTSKDNAELIVRAVNSFDAMQEALEAAHNSLRTFRNVPKDEQEWTTYDDAVMDAIEAALALASGEPRRG